MALPKQKIAVRPASETKISDLARKLIREADANGVLPTPIDRLFDIAKVTNIDALPDETFLQTLSASARGFFLSAKQKLRGIVRQQRSDFQLARQPSPFRIARLQTLVERFVARRSRNACLPVRSVEIKRRAGFHNSRSPAHQSFGCRPRRDVNHVDAKNGVGGC